MIDWVMNPSDKARDGKWLPVDKDLFSQLTGRPFPGEDNLSAEARLEYERRAIERCWRRIYITAKRVNPDCIILLSCQGVQDPVIAGTRMLREVDWIMDESGSAEAMRAIAPTLGSHTRQLLCVGGRGSQHDAAKILADTDIAEFSICGFSSPGPETIPGPVDQYLREPVESFKGDERNFACVVRFFNDLPLIPSPAP
ncbi:MAG: hypothetical protein GXY44_01955 [Phycisphaerales bacterium]|nr:hypothetical protein [Phycisphaerales bacterium]